MDNFSNNDIRNAVRERYAKAATGESSSCGTSCCGSTVDVSVDAISMAVGYSKDDVSSVPDGANLGLGCGNPQAIASLKAGETVLDLGSGGGFDCFLAARAVGETGSVIGVDMTPEMITKSRVNAEKGGFGNVSFRLGEMEHLPVADGIVDVIISNCVVNLSPEKEKVFSEAFRALKPGGRLAISDVVTTAELPQEIKGNLELYSACASGASSIDALEAMLTGAGFTGISIKPKAESAEFIREWAPGTRLEDYIVSATIEAVKP